MDLEIDDEGSSDDATPGSPPAAPSAAPHAPNDKGPRMPSNDWSVGVDLASGPDAGVESLVEVGPDGVRVLHHDGTLDAAIPVTDPEPAMCPRCGHHEAFHFVVEALVAGLVRLAEPSVGCQRFGPARVRIRPCQCCGPASQAYPEGEPCDQRRLRDDAAVALAGGQA